MSQDSKQSNPGQAERQIFDRNLDFNIATTSPPHTPEKIKPQWDHPLLRKFNDGQITKPPPITKQELVQFAYDYYLRLMPFFRNQPEGSLRPGVTIEFTRRMKQKLGVAMLFEHRIKLNCNYFSRDPSLLPNTLFHELTHLWLYNCSLDPGHTRRFYNKMSEFESTGLKLDPDVYIHKRVASESKLIYACPNCKNKWFMRQRLKRPLYCGPCFERGSKEYYLKPA